MKPCTTLAVGSVALLSAVSAAAQTPARPVPEPRVPASTEVPAGPPGTANLFFAGLAGSGVGLLVGGLVGGAAEHASAAPSEDRGLRGMLTGALVGSALSSAVLVHLANGREGHFWRALGATALATVVAASLTADTEVGIRWIVIPATQAAAAVAAVR